VSSSPPASPNGEFVSRQWAYFREADEAKYRWQTRAPVFAATERNLVSAAQGDGRFLEVGCGEGGNLFHLGPRPDLTVGLDYSHAKLGFAVGALPWARFVGADALSLPFRSDAFDRVFCRDVLHHLPEGRWREAVAELIRVCRPGGEIVVIEPNGRNPLIAALALTTPAERGLFRSTPERVAAWIRESASALVLEMAQPLPVARAVLHYRYGAPALGYRAWAARLFRAMDRMACRLLPRPLWAYVVIRARRAG
jgi:SAM-dependent methyltransferase